MGDNISRRSTLEAIQRHFNPTGEEMPTEVAAVLVGVGVVISTQPSTDRTGHWVEDEYGISHCSECGAINNTVYRNFCPECGADMRGADDESTI